MDLRKGLKDKEEQIAALEAERNRFKEALMFTVEAAESWHGDEAAKGRALAVIAEKARLALVEKAV